MGPDNRTHWQEPEEQTSNPGSSQRYGLAGTPGHGVHPLPQPPCGLGESSSRLPAEDTLGPSPRQGHGMQQLL